jgi:hypothetical protein
MKKKGCKEKAQENMGKGRNRNRKTVMENQEGIEEQ